MHARSSEINDNAPASRGERVLFARRAAAVFWSPPMVIPTKKARHSSRARSHSSFTVGDSIGNLGTLAAPTPPYIPPRPRWGNRTAGNRFGWLPAGVWVLLLCLAG